MEKRAIERIETTGQLTKAILGAVGGLYRGQSIHPAARSYQALRIYVNSELENVQRGLIAGIEALVPSGRVCAISFHSLEDRIVKDTFNARTGRCTCPPRMPECRCGAKRTLRVLTKKPVMASETETAANPRASAAKLRCAEKTEAEEN